MTGTFVAISDVPSRSFCTTTHPSVMEDHGGSAAKAQIATQRTTMPTSRRAEIATTIRTKSRKRRDDGRIGPPFKSDQGPPATIL